MKANRTFVKKETQRNKYVFLPVVSDIHPGHDLIPGFRHFYIKKDADPKVTLIFDIPAFHKMSLHSNTVHVRLLNLTTELPINISDIKKQEVALEPNSRYRLTLEIKSKCKYPQYSTSVTYDFKPEK